MFARQIKNNPSEPRGRRSPDMGPDNIGVCVRKNSLASVKVGITHI